MTRDTQLRRVTVELLVKAGSQAEADSVVRDRMNDWFASGDLQPGTAGFPAGTLLHYTVTPVTGHRAVAA